MPYYSRIILNSFYNRLFPKLFRHNRRMPNSHQECNAPLNDSTNSSVPLQLMLQCFSKPVSSPEREKASKGTYYS